MADTTEEFTLRELADVLGVPLSIIVQAAHIEAKVFGYSRGHYVALHSPGSKPNAGLSTLASRIGDELIVRFLVDGIAFGFSSCVIHVAAQPDSLVFLEYPKAVAQVSIREDRRMPCNLVLGDGDRSSALLLDISEAGGRVASRRLSSERHGTEGMPVSLALALPPPEGDTRCIDGEVVRTKYSRQTTIAGIRFRQRHRELTTRLAAFLSLDDLLPQSQETKVAEARCR